MNVAVVGIGAMGGGIIRALLKSDAVKIVTGFDRSSELVSEFYAEATAAGKADPSSQCPPSSLHQAVTKETDVVILVLVNESQCQDVCFGGDNGENLETLMRHADEGIEALRSCVLLCSTVTATWARKAHTIFQSLGIHFVDCPVSGGPVRAKAGELTMMASGTEEGLACVKPLLDAAGKEVHIIPGGAGMGSTVKMVHQLLAGVHIVCAAEALALAAKAGLDVEQMYSIVNGAAGMSWMFRDRGARMIREGDDVMSALDIFVKDLDIVYSEAKALKAPIPVAAAALQQFISGSSLGLGRMDDSKVVKVYENITGVNVAKAPSERGDGDNVGDLWKMEGGIEEEIIEVGDEPRHRLALSNEYTRVLKVKFPPKDTTWAHRHAEDSLYFFLVEGGLNVINHVKGSDPQCDCMEFGEVRYGTHKTDKPLVHKITNISETEMYCIDAEVLKRPPITSPIPLVAECHELIKTRDKCRVYKLTLAAGQSVSVSYPFFYLSIVLKGSEIKSEVGDANGHGFSWTEKLQLGDVEWKTPCVALKLTNVGDTQYEQYVAEWC